MISMHDLEHFSHDHVHETLSSMADHELHALMAGTMPKDLNPFVSAHQARKTAHDILRRRGKI